MGSRANRNVHVRIKRHVLASLCVLMVPAYAASADPAETELKDASKVYGEFVAAIQKGDKELALKCVYVPRDEMAKWVESSVDLLIVRYDMATAIEKKTGPLGWTVRHQLGTAFVPRPGDEGAMAVWRFKKPMNGAVAHGVSAKGLENTTPLCTVFVTAKGARVNVLQQLAETKGDLTTKLSDEVLKSIEKSTDEQVKGTESFRDLIKFLETRDFKTYPEAMAEMQKYHPDKK